MPDEPPLLMPEEPDVPLREDPLLSELLPLVPASLSLSLSFFLLELFPLDEPDVPLASDAPDGLAALLVPVLPAEPEVPPVDEVCATATPVPNADTRIAIKSLFMNFLHPD
ncbi:hypothetical protein [Noviherbaspirillum saxi]|uniref:Uncharacterized protein n=1 Tax=Noviherbaspirillum saxi TaxID=2320863 RepID=A0A3A3FNU7_9BURK|nr:hypothetical protein [Noviherbaspirillum saxi]RJF95349.1 hypothetical protein D3871_18130 [Noviherbaspirillum saxi]